MSEYTVVVGLGNPDHVDRLMLVACMMAKKHEGRVAGVTVVEMESEAPAATPQYQDRMSRAYGVLEAAAEFAEGYEAEFEGHLAVAREVHEVINEMAQATGASLITVGFSERDHPRGDDSDFERLVDEIAHHAPCNLLVARFVGDPRYDRVLVPVRARLNLDLRRDLVLALQDQFSSQVDVVHFACNETEAEEKRQELEDWLSDRGLDHRVSLRVEVREDPAQAIVEASTHYDLALLGTAPLHEVRRKYFGSVPEYVAGHAACSTFLMRTREVHPES